MDKNIAALLREDARTIHVRILSRPNELQQAAMPRTARERALHASLSDGAPPDDFPENEPLSGKPYTYVTHLDVKNEDYVVVPAAGTIVLAKVVRIDDGVKIEPGSSTFYAWVICRVDLAGYQENRDRNAEITNAVAEAYKKNLRRSFQAQILSGLEGDEANLLQALMASPKKD